MNPTISQATIDEAMELDAASASAEWLAQFRQDIEAWVAREVVEAAVDPGMYERAPIDGVRYYGFCDPAGGSGADSMTLAIAHCEKRVLTLDALREALAPIFTGGDVGRICRPVETLSRFELHGRPLCGFMASRTIF